MLVEGLLKPFYHADTKSYVLPWSFYSSAAVRTPRVADAQTVAHARRYPVGLSQYAGLSIGGY
jgi:hypothetical protein